LEGPVELLAQRYVHRYLSNFRHPTKQEIIVVVVDEFPTSCRYRLDVMATSVVDVVSFAGGWLYDRTMDGWDITMLIAARAEDARPLHIIGARTLDLEAAFERPERHPAALSVAADLYASDERVRHAVSKTLRLPTPEITVWGEDRPAELSRSAAEVQHQLTSAASVFKMHALTAAGLLVDCVDPLESFGMVRRNPRVAEDGFCDGHPRGSGGNRCATR
jgi:hypothetical protein